MTDLRQLGYEIRKARERKKLTQSELGSLLGMSRASVGLLETGGTKYPRADTLAAIAGYLDVPPVVFYELAGIKLTSSVPAQLQWLANQLDDEGNELLVELGHALLRERQRRALQTAGRKASRSRS